MKAITFLMFISTINYCYSIGNSFFSSTENDTQEFRNRIINCHVLAAKFKRPILANKDGIVQGIIVLLATDQGKTEKSDPLHLVSNTRYIKEKVEKVEKSDAPGEKETSSSLQTIFDEMSKRGDVYLVRIGALYHTDLGQSSLIDLTEQYMTDTRLFHNYLPEWSMKNEDLKAVYDQHRFLVKNCTSFWDNSDRVLCSKNGYIQEEFELSAVQSPKNPCHFDGNFLNLPNTLLDADGELDQEKAENKRQREEEVRKKTGIVSK